MFWHIQQNSCQLFGAVQFIYSHSFLQKLIRKDGDYHSSRLMDGKDMQANQNMQPKKKHKKSGSSNKVKEKVEVRIDSKLHVQVYVQKCKDLLLMFGSVSTYFVTVLSTYFHQSIWKMTVPWKSRRTSSVTTAMELSGAATTSSDIYLHIQVRTHRSYLHFSVAFVIMLYVHFYLSLLFFLWMLVLCW